MYSVFPWQGEQCTTTVKSAIQQAFPFEYFGKNKNYIPDGTQRPSVLLNELRRFASTSKQHYDEHSTETIIKMNPQTMYHEKNFSNLLFSVLYFL